MPDLHDTASDVAAEDGGVHVSGPGGVVYSMTPDAATKTSDRLLESAFVAEGQRAEQRRKDQDAKRRGAP